MINETSVTAHNESFRLRLLLTDGCNQNCGYCLNDFQEKPKGEPQYLKMGKIIKSLREYFAFSRTLGYKPEVYLSGGEPTLHPRILDIIEAIQDIYMGEACDILHNHLPLGKLRIVICTNGNIKIGLRNKLKKLQKKYGNIFFTVSLHPGHFPSKTWCHEVKANYSIVLTHTPNQRSSFSPIYDPFKNLVASLKNKVKLLSIGRKYKGYFKHQCRLKVLDNFKNPDQLSYEINVDTVRRGVSYTKRPCTVESRPYKTTNCAGCDDLCCSHKSYWVRPDGSTSHCPKFKEVYEETDVEKAYSKHHIYTHFRNKLKEGRVALERFGRLTKHTAKILGMVTSLDDDSPDKVPSVGIETVNIWLNEKQAKYRPFPAVWIGPGKDPEVILHTVGKSCNIPMLTVEDTSKSMRKRGLLEYRMGIESSIIYDELPIPTDQFPTLNNIELGKQQADRCDANIYVTRLDTETSKDK